MLPTASDIDRFVTTFAAHWSAPDGGFEQVMHPGATLRVAGAREPSAYEEARHFVAAVKRAVPDIELRVLEWAAREASVFVEWEMSGTLGGRRVTWQGINRNHLEGSKSIAGVSCWDRWSLLEQVEPARPPLDLARELVRVQTDPGAR
ncbi:MAG TPA: nuclear transport factor 2 family protein [Acidimicrobiia bacterium]